MKRLLFASLAILLVGASEVRAEYLHVNLSIFGMD
jgi:hypothetical protein